MKRIIKIQVRRNQTTITIPMKLAKKLEFGKDKICRVWVNEDGNLEIEVINLDQEKIRHSQRIADDENSRAENSG